MYGYDAKSGVSFTENSTWQNMWSRIIFYSDNKIFLLCI